MAAKKVLTPEAKVKQITKELDAAMKVVERGKTKIIKLKERLKKAKEAEKKAAAKAKQAKTTPAKKKVAKKKTAKK